MNKNEIKILFICKKKCGGYGEPAGLINSAQFVVNALVDAGYCASLEFAIDANCLDRIVTENRPTHVVIEALWVTPEKFKELMTYPDHAARRWIVRIHSKMPFLAQEGIALDWIERYQDIHQVIVSPNSKSLQDDLQLAMWVDAPLLPNIYNPQWLQWARYYGKENSGRPWTDLFRRDKIVMNIGCFGAIRPLKNQLEQAIAAIIFCQDNDYLLRFHINASRVENRGEEVLKNLRALFRSADCELVEHGWLDHEKFVTLVSTMDLGMQVSFSESFNIVAADFVLQRIPVLVSRDIDWMPKLCTASPTSAIDMAKGLERIWALSRYGFHRTALWALEKYNRQSLQCWEKFLGGEK